MAARMKFLGIRAAVVGGRVRDLAELRGTELPVCFLSSPLPFFLSFGCFEVGTEVLI